MKQTLYQRYKSKGFNFFVGVPCSGIKDFIIELEKDPSQTYIPATKEDSALGIAVGAYLTGKKPLVFLQSSGLGNIVNGITSLLKPYGIKIDLLLSLRKTPFEHEYMYKVFYKLLNDLEYQQNVTIVKEDK